MIYGIYTTDGVIYYGTENECTDLAKMVGGQVHLYHGTARN